ncbi:hypothetical protein [Bifidobacterium sp. ESL0732]|uniref:hypothetical protein n=1 Tax=Bifidobacterium sp. ESL0732 TaxID=2983222 RepID=UPI0023F754B4|nr:hypothetical protein [Bifidobacterium sp. ESL0732]WEV64545.1 hypothetical protein OZX70_02915 [Bifidobacterium sp. ESL0732]
MSADLTIISPLSWVQEAFKEYFGKAHMSDNSHSNVAFDYGFEPACDLEEDSAVWITPDLLIANNVWRERNSLPALRFTAPAADWLATLPEELRGRTVITVPVSNIRAWAELPEGLSERPWSQLSRGRVPEFRAARRGLSELQQDLGDAPADSLITINTHIDGIKEEWCVIINHGKAVASSGYCVHRSADEESHDILTVFDEARFHDSYRTIAESAATQAAQVSHLDNASIIVGFRETDGDMGNATSSTTKTGNCHSAISAAIPQLLIIEADPVWCTTPYTFETAQGIKAFLNAISDCRIIENNDGTFKNRNGQRAPKADIYTPDPWMIRHAEHRYDRF